MNLFTFIFLICLYALFFIYQAFSGIELEQQILYSSIFILLFGIPHGAIDHILFFKKRKMSQLKFYTLYLSLILLFLIFWLYQPMWSFLFFLVLSAFHFGQSQFADLKTKKTIYSNILFIIWGLTLLVNLIFYNANELNNFTAFFDDTVSFQSIYKHHYIRNSFILFNVVNAGILAYLMASKQMIWSRFTSEIFLIALIHLTFYLFPFIIGFTLYFVVLHSIRVMSQEFNYFKSEDSTFSLLHFLKLLMPHTLLSIFSTIFILWLSYKEIIPLSVPLTSLIIISVITLPHAIVMHIFYQTKV